jgi:hypothetical protein
MNPWDQLPSETGKEYNLFLHFLEMGIKRSVNKLVVAKLGAVSYISGLCKKHDWRDRAAQYDRYNLIQAVDARQETIEYTRQVFFDHAISAAEAVVGLATGRMEPGDTMPVLNRHGDVVGEKPIVTPAVRLKALVRTLELVGLTVPKRVELDAAEPPALESAKGALEQLGESELEKLAAIFEGEVVPDGEAVH